jgi:anti-sigma factor RsiW
MNAETTQKLYEAFCEDLDAYCDGTLPDARRREIAAFLQASPQARATLQEFQQAHDLFENATWDVPEPTRAPSAQDILAAARTRPVARPSWRDRFAAWRAGLTWRSPAFAAAALLAVGAGVGWLALTASRTPSPQESAAVAPSPKPAPPETAEAARAPESAPDATAKSVESPAAPEPTAKPDAGPLSIPGGAAGARGAAEKNELFANEAPKSAATSASASAPDASGGGLPSGDSATKSPDTFQPLEESQPEKSAIASRETPPMEKKSSDAPRADELIARRALGAAPPATSSPSRTQSQPMKTPLKANDQERTTASGRPESANVQDAKPKTAEPPGASNAPPAPTSASSASPSQ